MTMRLLSWLAAVVFWRHVPHRHHFERVTDAVTGLAGHRCRRCGTAVWYHVGPGGSGK